MKKIIDQYTNLPVSKQRKYQLRHPEKLKVLQERYRKSSDKVRKYYSEYGKRWRESHPEYYKNYKVKIYE